MINKIKKIFRRVLKNKLGVVTMEYALGMALIGSLFIISMTDFRQKAVKMFYCNTPDQANQNSEMCQAFPSFSKTMSMSGSQFNTGISVKAGQTYVIKAANVGQKVSYWNSGKDNFSDPFNSSNSLDLSNGKKPPISSTGLPLDANGNFSMGAFAAVSSKSLDGQSVHYNNAAVSNLDFTFAQNGEIRITTKTDGFLQVGIMDTYYGDNRTSGTTDGSFGFDIKQVE